MKKNLFIISFLFFVSLTFPEEIEFDEESLFFEAEDVAVEQSDASEYVASQQEIKIGSSEYYIPLKFTGHLESNLGFYTTKNNQSDDNDELKNGAYFDFENYIYFLARLDKTLSIRGSTSVSFPPVKDSIKLEELYFDYLIWDRVYITAGKKETVWGYTRLFSDEDAYSLYTSKQYGSLTESEKEEIRQTIESQGYLYTNILSDSKNGVSGLMRIPFWTGTLSGMILYSGSSTEPEFDDISIAGSVEMTFFHTTFNLFGRKSPRDSTTNAIPILLGAEAKRTILGADVYAQGIGKLNDAHDDFTKLVFTGGFYRLWDAIDPNFGFNIEVQDSYNRELSKSSYRLYIDTGLKRLGKNKDLKIGVQWQHIIKSETDDDRSGLVKFGFEKGGLFPHATWETGVEIYYHQVDDNYENEIYKVRFGSTLQILMDY